MISNAANKTGDVVKPTIRLLILISVFKYCGNTAGLKTEEQYKVKKRLRRTEICLGNSTEKRLEGRQICQGTVVRNCSLGQDWPRQEERKIVSCNFKRTEIARQEGSFQKSSIDRSCAQESGHLAILRQATS